MECTGADPASRVRTPVVRLDPTLEAEVNRWVTLVAHRVGRVAAGMDEGHRRHRRSWVTVQKLYEWIRQRCGKILDCQTWRIRLCGYKTASNRKNTSNTYAEY